MCHEIFRQISIGNPEKPLGLLGKGGATERVNFPPLGENERCAVCDDADAGILTYFKELLAKMTENIGTDARQRR